MDRRGVTDVALNYGCRGQVSEERRRHMEDGAKLSRALIMPFPIRAGGRLNARVRNAGRLRENPVRHETRASDPKFLSPHK